LKRVLVYRQSITPPWVRVNRIQRDFKVATEAELGFTSNSLKTNLAQMVKDAAESQGIYCQCIRCCEVSELKYEAADIQYKTRQFTASGSPEFFVSAEIERPRRNILLGFLRLRLGNALEESIIPELKGNTAMIRELHVYGRVKEVGNDDSNGATQHLGIGKKLLAIAEEICRENARDKIAIISGIGVRQYYQKRGYNLEGTYMIKYLDLLIP
jgi:elongator complex protein 3